MRHNLAGDLSSLLHSPLNKASWNVNKSVSTNFTAQPLRLSRRKDGGYLWLAIVDAKEIGEEEIYNEWTMHYASRIPELTLIRVHNFNYN